MKRVVLSGFAVLALVAISVALPRDGTLAIDAADAASLAKVPEGRIIVRACASYPTDQIDCREYLASDVTRDGPVESYPELFALEEDANTQLTYNRAWEGAPLLTPDREWFILPVSESRDSCGLARMPSRGGPTLQLAGASETTCFEPHDISSDGLWLLHTTWEEDMASNLYKRSTQGGPAIALTDMEDPNEVAYAARWLVPNQKVIFAASPGGRAQRMYSIDADGENQNQLAGPASGWEIEVSPDGRRVAYSSYEDRDPNTRGIYVMRTDGTHKRLLARAPAYMSRLQWSPDGTTISYIDTKHYDRDSRYRLRTVDVKTKEKRTLVSERSWFLTSWFPPSWSPSGDHLAFTAGKLDFERAVFVIDRSGKALRRVTPWHRATEMFGWFPS